MAVLNVSVVAADHEVWSGEASMVVAKTVEGEIGILAGHEPLLAILASGEVRVTLHGGESSRPRPTTASSPSRTTPSRSWRVRRSWSEHGRRRQAVDRQFGDVRVPV